MFYYIGLISKTITISSYISFINDDNSNNTATKTVTVKNVALINHKTRAIPQSKNKLEKTPAKGEAVHVFSSL